MKTDEAIEICERWFKHLKEQVERSKQVQECARMARNGQQDEARRRLAQIDRTPRVFDGATLEPAVRALVKLARASTNT